jgi:hypothetical protein
LRGGAESQPHTSKNSLVFLIDVFELPPLLDDHVVWAYRLLLDREHEDVIGPKLAGSANTAELRHHLITSAEFRRKNPDFAQTNDPTLVIREIAPGVRLSIDLSDHAIGLNIWSGRC